MHIHHWWDTVALDKIQGNHFALRIVFHCYKTMYNLGLSFALPALYGCSFLLRLPEKDFLKLIVTPKYFLTYCFVEHEVRSGILLWVLLIHFQTSMYLQGLNNVLSPNVCKHTGLASNTDPGLWNKISLRICFLCSGILLGIFFFFLYYSAAFHLEV